MSVQEFEAIFASSIQKIFFTNDAPLFYEGHFLSGLYFIKKGKVNLTKKNKIKCILRKNQIIGIGQLLLESKSCQSAVVEKNSEILFVSKLDAVKKISSLSNLN